MTLDEAIKHAEEVAEKARNDADSGYYDEDKCLACAKEHEQLAGWLKELKDLRIFAAFAAKSVCSDEFEEDSDFYAEVLCRKLTKLGYIELDGDTYKLKENSTCTEQP